MSSSRFSYYSVHMLVPDNLESSATPRYLAQPDVYFRTSESLRFKSLHLDSPGACHYYRFCWTYCKSLLISSTIYSIQGLLHVSSFYIVKFALRYDGLDVSILIRKQTMVFPCHPYHPAFARDACILNRPLIIQTILRAVYLSDPRTIDSKKY